MRKANSTLIDLTGKQFGDLRVIKRAGTDTRGNALWECVCKCGGKRVVQGTMLNTGKVTHCVKCRSHKAVLEKLRKEYIGKKFGKLTVLSIDARDPRRIVTVCKCVCGVKRRVKPADLESGKATSCLRCRLLNDLSGRTFGRWTVIKPLRRVEPGHYDWLWLCKCECGTKKEVRGVSLKKGVSQSCGCLRKERAGRKPKRRKNGKRLSSHR